MNAYIPGHPIAEAAHLQTYRYYEAEISEEVMSNILIVFVSSVRCSRRKVNN